MFQIGSDIGDILSPNQDVKHDVLVIPPGLEHARSILIEIRRWHRAGTLPYERNAAQTAIYYCWHLGNSIDV